MINEAFLPEFVFREELRLSHVDRMWSLKRAQCFVNYLLLKLGHEDPIVVTYGAHVNFSGYFSWWDSKIYICRNHSTPEKWRTLIHEMTHIFHDDHDAEFLSMLRTIRQCWALFNKAQLFSKLT